MSVEKRNEEENDEVLRKFKLIGREICELHEKEIDVVCETEKDSICSHCAIFGNHREHEVIPKPEFLAIVQNKLRIFNEFMVNHKVVTNPPLYESVKERLFTKLETHRKNLIEEAANEFTELHNFVEISRKSVLLDINEISEELKNRITNELELIKLTENELNGWLNKGYNSSKLIVESTSLTELVSNYYSGPLWECEKGFQYLEGLKHSSNRCIIASEALIKETQLNVHADVEKAVLNFITLKYKLENSDPMINKIRPQQHEEPSKSPSLKLDLSQIKHLSSTLSSTQRFSSKHLNSRLTKASSVKNIDSIGLSRAISSNNGLDSIISNSDGIKINKGSIHKLPSPRMQQQPTTEMLKQQAERRVSDFCHSDSEVLDLLGLGLTNQDLTDILNFIGSNNLTRIRHLKLCSNKITNAGFHYLLDVRMSNLSNINLAGNLLTETCLEELYRMRNCLPNIKQINLSTNKINERKVKFIIDELKKKGIVVTL